tara:strand:- start:218 stop:436 length:219 start_codon:yes stop_codon:yes gene_type:complete
MGCGCNKRKKKRMQSSRMPVSKEVKTKKINGITVPQNMSPNQRRSTIAKINNAKKVQTKKTREQIINERKCK